MAATLAHLTALEEAYYSGASEVTYEGKTVKYGTDLKKRINEVRAELIAQGLLTDTRNPVSVTSFSKG